LRNELPTLDFQLNFHAIGDSTTLFLFKIYKEVLAGEGRTKKIAQRHRQLSLSR
jgi:hypothetical protein